MLESIEGIIEFHKTDPYDSINQTQIQIFFKSPISKMLKPRAKSQPLMNFQELPDSNQLERYPNKWFEMSDKFRPIFDLHHHLGPVTYSWE
jgi:hypothetical protein